MNKPPIKSLLEHLLFSSSKHKTEFLCKVADELKAIDELSQQKTKLISLKNKRDDDLKYVKQRHQNKIEQVNKAKQQPEEKKLLEKLNQSHHLKIQEIQQKYSETLAQQTSQQMRSVTANEETLLNELQIKYFKLVVSDENWLSYQHGIEQLVQNFLNHKSYDGSKCYSLLRCPRNLIAHIDSDQKNEYYSNNVQQIVGSSNEKITEYFLKKFKNLLPVMVNLVVNNKNTLPKSYDVLINYSSTSDILHTLSFDNIIQFLVESVPEESFSERFISAYRVPMYGLEVYVVSPPINYQIPEGLTFLTVFGNNIKFTYENHCWTQTLDNKIKKDSSILQTKCDVDSVKTFLKSTNFLNAGSTMLWITNFSEREVDECMDRINHKKIELSFDLLTISAQSTVKEKVVKIGLKDFKIGSILFDGDDVLPDMKPVLEGSFLKQLLSKGTQHFWPPTDAATIKISNNLEWMPQSESRIVLLAGRHSSGKTCAVNSYCKTSKDLAVVVGISDETFLGETNTNLQEMIQSCTKKKICEIKLLGSAMLAANAYLIFDGIDNLVHIDSQNLLKVDSVNTLIEILEKEIQKYSKVRFWLVCRPRLTKLISRICYDRNVTLEEKYFSGIDKEAFRNIVKESIYKIYCSNSNNDTGLANHFETLAISVCENFEKYFQLSVFLGLRIGEHIRKMYSPIPQTISLSKLTMCKIVVSAYFSQKFTDQKISSKDKKQLESKSICRHAWIAFEILPIRVKEENPVISECLDRLDAHIYGNVESISSSEFDEGVLNITDIVSDWTKTCQFYDEILHNYFIAFGLRWFLNSYRIKDKTERILGEINAILEKPIFKTEYQYVEDFFKEFGQGTSLQGTF